MRGALAPVVALAACGRLLFSGALRYACNCSQASYADQRIGCQ